MSLSKLELMESVRIQLGDNQDIQEWDIRHAVYQAARRVCQLTSCLTPDTAVSIDLASATSLYDKDDFTNTDATRIFKILYVKLTDAGSNSRILTYMDLPRFYRLYPTYETDTDGTPTTWVQLSENRLMIYPTPSSTFMSSYPDSAIELYGPMTPDIDNWGDGETLPISDTLQYLIEIHAVNSLLLGFNNDQSIAWKTSALGDIFTNAISQEIGERKYVY